MKNYDHSSESQDEDCHSNPSVTPGTASGVEDFKTAVENLRKVLLIACID